MKDQVTQKQSGRFLELWRILVNGYGSNGISYPHTWEVEMEGEVKAWITQSAWVALTGKKKKCLNCIIYPKNYLQRIRTITQFKAKESNENCMLWVGA